MLSLVLKSTRNQKNEELWYWVLNSPSGAEACFSPYYFCEDEAAQAARAFIYNMNTAQVFITMYDLRIKPTTVVSRQDLPYEKYFMELYKATTPITSAPSPTTIPRAQALKKTHLKLVDPS